MTIAPRGGDVYAWASTSSRHLLVVWHALDKCLQRLEEVTSLSGLLSLRPHMNDEAHGHRRYLLTPRGGDICLCFYTLPLAGDLQGG
jgi:hypothetical protein